MATIILSFFHDFHFILIASGLKLTDLLHEAFNEIKELEYRLVTAVCARYLIYLQTVY